MRSLLFLSFALALVVAALAVLLNDWPLVIYSIVISAALLVAALALVTNDAPPGAKRLKSLRAVLGEVTVRPGRPD